MLKLKKNLVYLAYVGFSVASAYFGLPGYYCGQVKFWFFFGMGFFQSFDQTYPREWAFLYRHRMPLTYAWIWGSGLVTFLLADTPFWWVLWGITFLVIGGAEIYYKWPKFQRWLEAQAEIVCEIKVEWPRLETWRTAKIATYNARYATKSAAGRQDASKTAVSKPTRPQRGGFDWTAWRAVWDRMRAERQRRRDAAWQRELDDEATWFAAREHKPDLEWLWWLIIKNNVRFFVYVVLSIGLAVFALPGYYTKKGQAGFFFVLHFFRRFDKNYPRQWKFISRNRFELNLCWGFFTLVFVYACVFFEALYLFLAYLAVMVVWVVCELVYFGWADLVAWWETQKAHICDSKARWPRLEATRAAVVKACNKSYAKAVAEQAAEKKRAEDLREAEWQRELAEEAAWFAARDRKRAEKLQKKNAAKKGPPPSVN